MNKKELELFENWAALKEDQQKTAAFDLAEKITELKNEEIRKISDKVGSSIQYYKNERRSHIKEINELQQRIRDRAEPMEVDKIKNLLLQASKLINPKIECKDYEKYDQEVAEWMGSFRALRIK